MCLVLYAASSYELPQVAWDETARGFNVSEVAPDAAVRTQFDLHHVYELGSHEGCGCGFSIDDDSAEDLALRQQSVAALARYLEVAAKTGPVQLFACWAGGESASRPARTPLSLAQVADGRFWNQVMMDAVRDIPSAFTIEGESAPG